MLGNKPPYTTMQQLNLDWILSKLKTLLRLVPDDGAVGQILRRTRDGAVWSDEQGGGGGGAVQSVNGKTGAVVLDAADVGALPDDYAPPVASVNGKTGAVVLDATDVGALPDDYTPPVTSVNGKTGAVVLGKSDVGLANVDNVKQYSATNPPPYPVTSVNGQTGAVSIPVGTTVNVAQYSASVTLSANTKTYEAFDASALYGKTIIGFALLTAPNTDWIISSVRYFAALNEIRVYMMNTYDGSISGSIILNVSYI